MSHTPVDASPEGLMATGRKGLAEQLAARLGERIRDRLLLPGARLPSVREAARLHRISPSTVVAAYEQLMAKGWVESRPQRGFFVRGAASSPAPNASPTPTARQVPPIDATALIRGMFQHPASQLSPGMGTLPSTWLDLPMLHTALRRAISQEPSGAQSLHYGHPAGDPSLRQALVQRLQGIGVNTHIDHIITTMGATHALDIISRSLLQPGDAVLVDEPGWAVEFARLTRQGMRLLAVPRGPEGPDIAVMQALIEQHHPKLYVTASVLHNPTGANLPLAAAHQVLKLAEAHGLTVVEDDTYAHFAPPHAPRLSALDGLERTVYVSGFSKILAPGWRVGYMAAPAHLVERFIDTKLLGSLTTPSITEQALASCLNQGLLRRHAERVVKQLGTARARVQRLALDAGCHFMSPPQGLFGWIDTGVDTETLAQHLLDEGWLTAPGRLFHASPRPSTLMRVNFATSQDAGFWKALASLR